MSDNTSGEALWAQDRVGIRLVTANAGGLATALGLQASGLRAAAALSGAELSASLDLLAEAVRRRLPLVVRLTAGGDHRAYHAAAATGALQLFAASAQEAADLELIARHAAEAALVPAVVAVDGGRAAAAESEVSTEAVRRYLGRAGDAIHPPTPSQAMLFGKHRRRVPRWHDLERPLLTGAVRDGEAEAPGLLARRVCFDAHLPELLEQAVEAFAGETGRRLDALRSHRVRGAKLLLVAQGAAVETAEAVAEELRADRGPKVGVVGIRTLRPLPADQLAELVAGHRAVAVLERLDAAAGTETPLAEELRAILDRARENDRFGKGLHPGLPALAARDLPRLTSAFYGLGDSPLRAADLAELCRQLAGKGAERRSPIYLGLGTATAAGFPKRQAHLDALRRSYPEIASLSLRAEVPESDVADGKSAVGTDRTPPAVVRRMTPSSVPMADLAAFGDRAGALQQGGDASDLIPDPFLASGTLPPLSAALSATVPERPSSQTSLPAFEPALCTACGDCWSACPDGAVGPLVLGPAALLDEGMRLAARRGRSVDKLRMVKSKLADATGRAMAAGDGAGGTLGEVFDAAFEPLIDKMKLPGARKAQVREAYGAVREEVAALPVARTEPFFDDGGNLFSLAIDPDACKGCGLCVVACEPKAMIEATDSPERTAEARSLWRLWEELPAPPETVIEQASQHRDVGPLAGALLSRSSREVMTAAVTEAGSGEALAVRQVLGVAASRLTPMRERLRTQVEELRSKLAAAIHQQLSQALPDRDLEALARGLEALEQPDAELSELTERVETAFETERVDVPGTRRLVDAGRELADLAWRLEKGEGGLGRAPFAAVLAGSPAAWGGTFPNNPFAVPVTVATTGAAALARGLLEGQREQALGIVRVLRQARAELDRGAGSRKTESGDDELRWDSLDAEERRLCPPLLLLASEAALAGPELGATLAALDTELPLKVFAFHDPGSEDAGSPDLGVLALTSRMAFVAQSSIAHFGHSGVALVQALAGEGPSLIRMMAPSPARGGFDAAATLEQARATKTAGEISLWTSEPEERAGRSLADLWLEPAAVAEAPPQEDTGEAATPPAPVADAGGSIEQRHAAELAAVRAQYEAHIANLRAGLKTEMAHQVRGKLMQLVAGARGAVRPPGPMDGESPEAEE